MTDLLLVCLGSTAGLRAAEDELAASLERAGASVARATARPPREVRTFMATDLAWACAARRAALDGIAASSPRAIVYSTTTAALLWPRRGAIRFDALAAATRPGRHGLWQRPVEARRLAQAPLLVPQAASAFEGTAAPDPSRIVVVPVPVEPSGPTDAPRDVAAVTYGANWRKKGLDRVLAAWAAVAPGDAAGRAAGTDPAGPARADELVVAGVGHRGADELVVAGMGHRATDELVVAGVDAALVAQAWAAGGNGGPLPASVRVAGPLPPAEYRALLRRARVYVTAPRREDYGIAQLEALADGCALVTSAAPGPYAALGLARALDARFVAEAGAGAAGLAAALRAALEATAPDADQGRAPMRPHPVGPHGLSTPGALDYAVRATAALAPFSRAAADRIVAGELLCRLLA